MKKSIMAFVAGVAVAGLMVISLVVLAAAQTSGGSGAAPAQGATTGDKSAAQPQGSPVTKPTNGAGGSVSDADIIRYYNLYMQSLAANLGVSNDKLTSSMNQAAKDTVNQAVKDGKLTQAQADELSGQWANMQTKVFAMGIMAGGGDKPQCPATPQSNLENQVTDAAFQALATKLGMNLGDLKQALGSSSVADLATSKNVSIQEIKTAVIDAIKPILDQAVKDGTINQQQEDTLIQMFVMGIMAGGGNKPQCPAAPQSNLESQVNDAAGQALASKLGMSVDQVKQALGSGKSVADLAASKNVSVQEIKTAVINAIKPILDQAVQAHTITQQQEDTLIQTVQNADLSQPISALTIGGGAAGNTLDDTFLRQVMEQSFQSAADKLGITKDQLMQQLGQGKSLADIAASKNVSQADLKTAIANGIKPVLDQGVKDGKISQQQEDAILQGVQSIDLTQNPKDLLRPLAGNPKMCQ